MTFFSSAVNVLQTLVIAIGAGLGIWGVINLLEVITEEGVKGRSIVPSRCINWQSRSIGIARWRCIKIWWKWSSEGNK